MSSELKARRAFRDRDSFAGNSVMRINMHKNIYKYLVDRYFNRLYDK